jgi:hypothetical protein
MRDKEDDRERRREYRSRRSRIEDGRSESRHREDLPSGVASLESPQQPKTRRENEKDRVSNRRSRRSRRRRRGRSRSRSRTVSRNGEARQRDRDSVPLEQVQDTQNKGSSSGDTASQINSTQRAGKDRPNRHEDEKDRRHDRERDRDRDRDRNRARDRDRDRDRDRARDRARDKDRKRPRRGRSASAESDSSKHRSRKVKRNHREESYGKDKESRMPVNSARTKDKSAKPSEAEKDPHTLEREARNRERLLKEQQRREAINVDRDGKGGRRREGKHERGLVSGRRLSYKYEDEEDDMARIEQEREAGRWA